MVKIEEEILKVLSTLCIDGNNVKIIEKIYERLDIEDSRQVRFK